MQLNLPFRSGFSLAEMIVVLALLALLLTLLLNTLSAHQKVFRAHRERVLVSEQLREGKLALLADIRGMAVAADTPRILADSALEFFATIGSSVICTAPEGQVVSLVPAGQSNGLFLTSFPLPPDTGDIFAAYSRRDSLEGVRRWLRFRIASVTTSPASSACPASTGFTVPADAQRPSLKITLTGSLSEVGAGAPVRILRRGRYSLYRSSDGDWYLGYKRCNAVGTGCSTIQPVSGPYLSYSSANGGGLRFIYMDSLGVSVPSSRPRDVASVEITFRAEVAAAGRVSGRWLDSAVVVVTPRNLH